VRVERELRQRRRTIESAVSELEERRDSLTKSADEVANKIQDRILSLV